MLAIVIMAILFVVGGTALLVAAANRATLDRSKEFSNRDPYPVESWHSRLPSLNPQAITEAVEAIAAGLFLKAEYLHPEYRFDKDFKLRSQFVIDDDPLADVADSVKDRLGIDWDSDWQTVGDAVSAIAKQLNQETLRQADAEEQPPAEGL